MAENTQERKTFKWGDQEYLLDDLLKAHAEQRNYFHNFARDKMFYDENAIRLLDSAMEKRLGAVKEGKAFSADGKLDDDVAQNITLQLNRRDKRKYGKEFGKDTTPDTDITAAAAYYLSKLVGQMSPYQRKKADDSNAWNMDKHGFSAYLTGQGLNAQDIFEKYDLRDANNPEAARSFAQRDSELRKHLAAYKAWLEGKDFDFTKNDNEWDDNFMTTLSDLINSNDWSNRTALAASLRKLGAGDEYTTAFTSDRWDLTKSKEELDAETKAAKEAEAAKIKQGHLDEFEQLAYDNRRVSKPTYYKGYDGDFSIDWYGDLNQAQRNEWGTYLGRDNQAWGNAWANLITALKSGKAYSDKNAGILLQGTFKNQPHAFIDLGDGKYLIRDSVTDYGQGTVYDPNSGYTDTVFLGDLAGNNSEIQNIYRQLAYKYANNKYGTKYEDRPDILKEGGELIPKHQYGNAVAFNWESSNKESIKEKAKENNLDPEVQKARDRYIDSDNKSVDNPDAEFTGAEIARLVSIGADITSMFLDPITGTATGLGSTILNFGADIADDGFQWEDVKNLGINVGFDLLGAIPIFGDAVGTGTKITRKLIKWAPRMMGILAGYQGVKNFGGMMESWQKMVSNDEDAKMTVQDWRNIAQSISLVTGGVRAVRNKAQQSKMRSEARVDGVLGVNIRNKNTGDIEQILVDGKTAEQIRNAKGNTAEIEKVLNDLDAYKGKFGENGDFVVNAKNNGSWQSPVHRRELQDGTGKKEWEYRGFRQNGGADVNEVYDFSRVTTGYGAGRGWKIPGVSDLLNQWHQNLVSQVNSNKSLTTVDQKGKLTNEAFEAEQTRLLNDQDVEAQIGKVKDAVAARKKYLEDLQGRITETEGELVPLRQQAGGDDFVARQTDAETRLAGLPSKQAVNDAQAIVNARQRFIDKANKRRQALADSRQKQISDMETGLNARLDVMNKTLTRLKSRKRTLEAKQNAGTISKKEATELKKLSSRIKDVQKSIKNTQSEIVTNTARIKSLHGQKRAQLKADIKTAKGEIATAAPIASQSKDVATAIAQRDAAIAGQTLQRRLNALQGRQTSHNPATTHTRAYQDLEAMLNSLRTSNPTIGGKTVNWDMDAILQKYGVNASDVFKQGGSINRNKINKFLNYAKR